MDLNLDTLKRSISEHLEQSEFAIFHHDPSIFDVELVITWDIDTYPDYQMFLEAARKLGVRMLLFAAREFDEEEYQEAESELEESEMARDDRREYLNSLQNFRKHVGSTCSIELAFQYETHFYLYEARADWYEEFIGLLDEIRAFAAYENDDAESDGSMGGFYSNN